GEVLLELCWPDAELDAARNNLSIALSSLRQVLRSPGAGAGEVLEADRVSVRLNPAALHTDVAEFETALQQAAAAPAPEEQERLLARAAGLYQGPLLWGWYEDWIVREQERLADRY